MLGIDNEVTSHVLVALLGVSLGLSIANYHAMKARRRYMEEDEE